VAEGPPQRLIDELPLRVIEIQTRDTEGARRVLHELPAVRSQAQMGLRLHALMDRGAGEPVQMVRDALGKASIQAGIEAVRGNLEDVFVAATLGTGTE